MNWTRGLKPTINASEASMGRLTTESKPPPSTHSAIAPTPLQHVRFAEQLDLGFMSVKN